MARSNTPHPGLRYTLPDCQTFIITALDEATHTITIQFADGATETLDIGTWYKLGPAQQHAEPEPSDTPDHIALDPCDHASLEVAPGTEGLPVYRLTADGFD